MPLPDANDYSMRIYELLKETDLENLSYAQFQGVAEKLFIEPENEDEMRRLVLVQLARMAVRGDWNGFLTGGTGGAPTDAEYVVMALNGTLTNERKLTAGTGISISDGGAGGDVTIASTVTSPVTSLVAGSNITLNPVSGLGDVTINAASAPVTSLVAGSNITLSPASGLGDVTITAATPTGLAPNDASYLTLGLDADLTNERVLTAGTGIAFTDTGPNGTLTIEATGGGGGSSLYNPVMPATDLSSGSHKLYLVSKMSIFGSRSTGTASYNPDSTPRFWPFISPKSGNIDYFCVNLATDGTAKTEFAIYTNNEGVPDNKLGAATYTGGTGGTGREDLTPSSTIALVQGTQYWLGAVETVAPTGQQTLFTAESNGSCNYNGPISASTGNLATINAGPCLQLNSSSSTLPTTVTAANLQVNFQGQPRWGIVYA